MRITKISVTGLFGMFDHEIPLNQESRITIVHGPNGVGKTVLLGMLDGLLKLDYILFSMIRFNEFRVEFDSGNSITLSKQENSGMISYSYEDKTGARLGTFRPKRISAWPMILQSERRYWMQKDRWRQEDRLSKIANESLYVLVPALRTLVFGKTPGWLKQIRKNIQTSIVQTQRLDQGMKLSPPVYGVLIVPTILVLFLTIWMAGWQAASSTFFWLVALAVIVGVVVGVVIVILMVLFPHFRKFIRELIVVAEPRTGSVLEVGSDGEASPQEEMFENLVNDRLEMKSVDKDKDSKYIFRGSDGNHIPEWLLASGEKQLLHIYFHLLFKVESGTLVIIDEPEISLHVRLQREFLNDLQLIVELQDIDIIVATHSPQVVADKHHWLVELDFPGEH